MSQWNSYAPRESDPPAAPRNAPTLNTIAAILGGACVYGLLPATIRLLVRRGVVDQPGGRRSHVLTTPRGGGVVPWAVFSLLFTLSAGWDVLSLAILFACIGFGAIGALEDFVGVPVERRLLAQFAVALGFALLFAHGSRQTGLVVALLGVLCLVSFPNVFNFMDGINGLSVAQVVCGGGTFAVLAQMSDSTRAWSSSIILVAAAVGFLPYNFPHARVFLGDTGSYFFGAALAATGFILIHEGVRPISILLPLSLYVTDSMSTLVLGLFQRENVLSPHRRHVYQRLVGLGWSHVRVVVFAVIIMCVLSVASIIHQARLPWDRYSMCIAIAVLLGYLYTPAVVGRDD